MNANTSIQALRLCLAFLLLSLFAAGASAQTCTTTPGQVSGTFGGGGFGNAPLSQQMTATAAVNGSNLDVTITYTLTPTSPGTVTLLDVVFGPGFTSTVQTSTASNNITYNLSTPFQTSFAPPSFIRLPTTALGGGAMRAQGTISIPLGGNPVVNGKLVLVPMINGNFTPTSTGSTSRFSVANNTFTLPTDGNDSQGVCVTGFAPCPEAASSSFSASATTINAGQSTTLSFNVPNATAISIDNGVGSVSAPSGSVVVSPSVTTTYTLTATGQNGCPPVTLQVTITVTPCQTIISYSASSTTIDAGASATLSYTLTGATSATITDLTSGTVTPVPVQSGSLLVFPASTRTYRLSALGPCATLTQDITITVVPAPVITNFSSNVGSVCAGGQATLSYDASNATSADIDGTPVALPSGTLVVTPSAPSTTYTLTVRGGVGGAIVTSQQVTVSVTPSPAISSFSASATTINVGQSTTLSYSTSGGTSATITDLTSGVVTSVGVPNGSLVVTPPTSRSYRLTLTGACGTVSQDIAITVNQPPTINTFSASASPVCAGASSTLSWTSSGATSATITDLTSGTVTPVAVNGSLVVTPPTTRTYRLTVANGAGSVTSDVTVVVTPLAVINSFSASASTINAGQSTTLSFNVSNTTTRSITDQTSGVVTSLATESGLLVVTPPTTRTYRLTATSGCGTVTQDVTITVIQPPTISTFTASASPVCSGGASTLSWAASGGTSATISAAGLPGSPVAVNPNSGTLVVNPAATTTYTLTVTNSAGSVTRTVTVTVTPAPSIASYTASATTINVGQSTTLSYATSNSTSATITDLTSGTVTAVAVPNGSLVVTPPTTRTYRLTVNGTCGTVTQDITITVNQVPTINTFDASASPICSGASSTLSWSATNGTSATISAPGLPGSPVAVNATSGTLVVSPTVTTTYTLTVTNAAGSTTRTVVVTITPSASISTYTASSTNIAAGQSTTLSYTTSNTSSATITDLTSGTVTPVSVPNGSLVVTPATTRTYRLSVSGACGTVTQDITITVAPCQTIGTFTASATTINNGQSTTLSYTLTGATSATITDLQTGTATTVPVQSGTLVVSPNSSRTYRLSAVGPCATATRDLAITVNALPGIPLIGPQGQPRAVGPTSNNDDYTNMTATSGVAVPFGGVTTAGGSITFNNTVLNDGTTPQNMTLTASVVPPGFTVETSLDGGVTWINLGTSSSSGTLNPGQVFTLPIRVTYPAGLNVLTGHSIVLRLANTDAPATFNETIDRLWTGFVRADKSQIVTNPTGIGAANAAVPGAIIEYIVNYTNVTATSGTGNVNLTATNVVLTEDGNSAPNNWATTTNHVPASASDTLGGAITGDVAGSSLLTDTIPSLAPSQSGVFRFKRVIK